MNVIVEHLGGVQFEIKARQHRIACDQPPENGGFDEGMTPPELLLASLGSCVGFYAAQYLKNHELATEGTTVRVSAEKVKNPPRMDDFRIDGNSPGLKRRASRRNRGGYTALSDPQYPAQRAAYFTRGEARCAAIRVRIPVIHTR